MSSSVCKHVFSVLRCYRPATVKQLLCTLDIQRFTLVPRSKQFYHTLPNNNQLSDNNDGGDLQNNSYVHQIDENKDITSTEFTSTLMSEKYANEIEKGIGRTLEEQQERFLLPPDQPDDAKILRFGIIGVPNAGKSTLVNQLVNWKMSSVSSKVHTTRKNTLGVLTENSNQIVFVDTPGLVTSKSFSKHNIDRNMITDPENCIQAVNMIGIIVDVSNKWHSRELGQSILQLLCCNAHIPAILILNKIDKLDKRNQLLEITRILTEGTVDNKKADFIRKNMKVNEKIQKEIFQKHGLKLKKSNIPDHYQTQTKTQTPLDRDLVSEFSVKSSVDIEDKVEVESWQDYHKRMQNIRSKVKDKKGWPNFSNVFMISALNNDGVSDLKNYLLSKAQPGDWEFHSSFVTNQDPVFLAKNLVWEKLLDYLPEEVPYNVKIMIEMWELDDKETLKIFFNIICIKKKHVHMIVGKNGHRIKALIAEAQQSLMDAFRINILLKINVKLATKK
ncbi:GTPase Era, mitochondrial [Octopus bimaculoides]|nr:GTPase Era, mitochondrial [Octopus bimaculoides]